MFVSFATRLSRLTWKDHSTKSGQPYSIRIVAVHKELAQNLDTTTVDRVYFRFFIWFLKYDLTHETWVLLVLRNSQGEPCYRVVPWPIFQAFKETSGIQDFHCWICSSRVFWSDEWNGGFWYRLMKEISDGGWRIHRNLEEEHVAALCCIAFSGPESLSRPKAVPRTLMEYLPQK